VAESNRCLLVRESDHRDQLYFPREDIISAVMVESDHHTICPFKGEASYSNLSVAGSLLENSVWWYATPMSEVAGLAGYAAFSTEQVEVSASIAFDDASEATTRFPPWGTADDLAAVMDVARLGDATFTAPPYPNPMSGRRVETLALSGPRSTHCKAERLSHSKQDGRHRNPLLWQSIQRVNTWARTASRLPRRSIRGISSSLRRISGHSHRPNSGPSRPERCRQEHIRPRPVRPRPADLWLHRIRRPGHLEDARLPPAECRADLHSGRTGHFPGSVSDRQPEDGRPPCWRTR